MTQVAARNQERNMTNVEQSKLKYEQRRWHPNGVIKDGHKLSAVFGTAHGCLFEGDCLDILPHVADASIDTVFADPPFNIGKKYGPKFKDAKPETDYVEWCHRWVAECVRVLKPGGSLFIYNLPKWNVLIGARLSELGLMFRHWVAIDMKTCHYSLLYYSKGKPKTFRNVRVPIKTCRHCGGEIKDYGGHRAAMNPKGVNLSDVWDDIPPVRHWKFKSRNRKSNQLSTKLLNRVVQLSTNPGDIVLDPFGGSGTTFDVCEATHRHWIGIELENIDVIVERLESDLVHHSHDDFVEEQRTSVTSQKRTHVTNKGRPRRAIKQV
jgi:site-specific DNA-methyltransferase (adenine-specific)